MPSSAPTHRPGATSAPVHGVREQTNAEANARQRRRALPTNGKVWRLTRDRHLTLEPFCRVHLAAGVQVLANEVDHIDGDDSNNDPSNFQSLCKPCHSEKTGRERERIRAERRAAAALTATHAGAYRLAARSEAASLAAPTSPDTNPAGDTDGRDGGTRSRRTLPRGECSAEP